MHRADKAVLRLAVGLGLAVLIAYGFSMQLPFVVCILAILSLLFPSRVESVRGVGAEAGMGLERQCRRRLR